MCLKFLLLCEEHLAVKSVQIFNVMQNENWKNGLRIRKNIFEVSDLKQFKTIKMCLYCECLEQGSVTWSRALVYMLNCL